MKSVGDAIALAQHWHKGQMYGNEPYISHLRAVAGEVSEATVHLGVPIWAAARMVAWLHDILEDTDCPYKEVNAFGKEVYDAVIILTKYPRETYEEYIECIKASPLALIVKKADTYCNLRQSIIDGNKGRVIKYSKQLALLWE